MIAILIAGFVLTAFTYLGAILWSAHECDRLRDEYFKNKDL